MSTERRTFERLQELFHELVDLPHAERMRRLAAIRAEDAALHRALEELGVHDVSPSLDRREQALDQLADAFGAATAESPAVAPSDASPVGRQIGPYRLLRLLGQGGMGRVYEAEQIETVDRRVALKVLHAGLDSRHVLGRFEAERRSLAAMEHPHIARMLDAGSTEDGRPWFAMELVDGLPIDRWADARQLDIEQRIELLLPLCDAVQHAHRKGVVHRDLKPSNLLVRQGDDGAATPKVIDFGIAKVLGEPRAEPVHAGATAATRFGELLGTPEYMSPEQATLGTLDVDTRSDVYSLGLVLYKLLVGELPLPSATLRELPFDEICRRIREDDVSRPSPRLRGSVHGRWARRDLDAIVLKALAKDRERRYDSVAALANDLRRFLRDEPVAAAPPQWSYQAGKFLRRHRAATALATLAVLSLVVGLIAATLGRAEARRSEQQALEARADALAALRTSEEVSDFLVDLFKASDPRQRVAATPTLEDLLARGVERVDTLDDEPQVQARLLETLGEARWSLGDYASAEPLLERAAELRRQAAPDPAREAATLTHLSGLYRDRGELERAEELLRRAVTLLDGEGPSMALGGALNGLGIVLSRQQRLGEASHALERSLEVAETLATGPSINSAATLANLATVYARADDHEAALAASLRALHLLDRLLPPDHPHFGGLLSNTSTMAGHLGRHTLALRAATESVANSRSALPPRHPMLADHLHSLGRAQLALARRAEARAAFGEGLEIHDAVADADPVHAGRHHGALAEVALVDSDPAAALEHLDAAFRELPEGSEDRLRRERLPWLRLRAVALRRLGRANEAADAARRGHALAAELDQVDEVARFLLLEALAAHDRGDTEAADRLAEQALETAACESDVPCALDAAAAQVLRAHWHAARGQTDAAGRSLDGALEHPGWTAWMLTAPELAVPVESRHETKLARRLADDAADDTPLRGVQEPHDDAPPPEAASGS
ncbi:MAG: serine/threonine-protein kinase [Acidobacteriota bacterium]